MSLQKLLLPRQHFAKYTGKQSSRALSSVSSLVARSFMYVPAHSDKMISGLAKRRPLPDLPVLDCEDGVAFAAKAAAREGVRRALGELRLAEHLGRSVAVRINPPAGEQQTSASLAEEDIRCIMEGARLPDVLVLPKVENADEVAWLADRVARHRPAVRLQQPEPISLIVMIESGSSLLAMPAILDAAIAESRRHGQVRPVGCVFGSDDFCSSIGVERSQGGLETRHARAQFALVARSRHLLAIDMVEIDLADLDRFQRQCQEGRSMGFTGKQIIHPSQLPGCHEAFSPSPKRAAWAERLCAEFERHSASGTGAFVFEGQMIDMPTVRQADALLKTQRTLLGYEKAKS